MATNLRAGFSASLKVSTTSTAAGSEIGSVRNYTLTNDEAMADATSFDSSGWTERLPVKRDWSLTCEALWLTTGATKQQDELRGALTGGTRKYFTIGASTADQLFAGWGYVGQFTLSGDVNDVALHNFSIQGDGALTES